MFQLHTSEVNDADEYQGNILSVTDQNSLDDFLTTAEMAGRDFTASAFLLLFSFFVFFFLLLVDLF
jgi:large subunit GTPase 1